MILLHHTNDAAICCNKHLFYIIAAVFVFYFTLHMQMT